ncbi:hypothetical protein C1884_31055, partial [Pseudomonas sp. GW460-R15]
PWHPFRPGALDSTTTGGVLPRDGPVNTDAQTHPGPSAPHPGWRRPWRHPCSALPSGVPRERHPPRLDHHDRGHHRVLRVRVLR